MKRVAKRWGETPQFTQGVFAATFALGTAGILGLKITGAQQFLVTAWPIVLMVLYASLVFIPPIRLRPDQTGDNIYYLGFLFTLVSLGYSLHEFTVSAGVDEIVQNFGVAIGSTISGVFGRVLLNQMRTDPWEVERATRLALAESARNLRGELDNSVIEFNAYRRQIQQAAADGMRELQTIAAKQLGGATDRFERMVNDTTQRVETVVAHWSGTAEGFNAKSSEMADAMAKLSVRLEAVRAPAEIIDEKIQPAGEAVTRLAAAAEGAAANIQSALRQIESGAAELKSIVEGSREVVEFARSQSEVLSKAGAVLQAAQDQVREMEGTASRFGAELSQSVNELTKGLADFLGGLETQLAAAKALADQGQVVVAGEMAANIARMAQQIDELVRVRGSEAEHEITSINEIEREVTPPEPLLVMGGGKSGP